MTTNADITIYNKWYNSTTRLDEWIRTQIPGVSWYGGQAVTVSDNGLLTADKYAVRIPESSAPAGKVFVRPEVFAAKAKADLAAFWTLQNGDYVVHRLSTLDIKQPKELTGQRFIITGWNDNRRGGLPHWKVDGK